MAKDGSDDPVAQSLDRKVPLPAPVRIGASTIMFVAGIVLLLMGIAMLIMVAQRQILHPVGAAGIGVGLMAFAGIVVHVGWCVLQARGVGRSVRGIFALMFGVAAVGMLMRAWTSDSISLAAQAILSAFCAFLFVRVEVRR